MATANSTRITPATIASTAPAIDPATLTRAASDLCVSLQSFFDLAERELGEHSNTDFDEIKFLVKGAKADVFGFSSLVCAAENNEAQQPEGTGPAAGQMAEPGARGYGMNADNITGTAINELFNMRAMSLAARALIEEDPEDVDGVANAGRVMRQLADRALELINMIDKASLASRAEARP